MRMRTLLGLTLALATTMSCAAVQRSLGLGRGGSRTTTVLGHWVLATPIDSSAFAGASQVDLVLEQGSFSLTATYPNRPPLAISGRAELAEGNTLTLIPSAQSPEATTIGFLAGQPFTRVATASGSSLVLAPPTSHVPVPTSVWYRLDAARLAGLAR